MENVIVLRGTKPTYADIIAISNPQIGETWYCESDYNEYTYSQIKTYNCTVTATPAEAFAYGPAIRSVDNIDLNETYTGTVTNIHIGDKYASESSANVNASALTNPCTLEDGEYELKASGVNSIYHIANLVLYKDGVEVSPTVSISAGNYRNATATALTDSALSGITVNAQTTGDYTDGEVVASFKIETATEDIVKMDWVDSQGNALSAEDAEKTFNFHFSDSAKTGDTVEISNIQNTYTISTIWKPIGINIPNHVGLLKSNGNGEVLGAVAGTDYQAPLTPGTDYQTPLVAGTDYLAATNPTGTGSFSLNRKANTTVGDYSFAEGKNTTASGINSHAEGLSTIASNAGSHAEGATTTASGFYSHAEGQNTTASGDYSHAEGRNTEASGNYQHAQGKFNVLDQSGANAVYADIIGNGTADNNRKNIEATTWTGDKRMKGDVYVGCNDDSTGGTKLAKITEILTVPTTSAILKGNGNGGVSAAVEGTDYIGTAQRGRYAFDWLQNATPSMTLNENTVYVFHSGTPITTGSFTLGDFTHGLHLSSEWYVSFTAGANCSISFAYPTDFPIVWRDGVPSFTQGKTYEIDFLLQYSCILGIVSEYQ